MTTGEADVVFLIDETGSMGSQIQTVKRNVTSIIDSISHLPHCKSLRFGLVGYHDHEDSTAWTVCVHVPLTADVASMVRGVNDMCPDGGADYPEAVADGLYELARLGWRPNASKTAVLIADAPPHAAGGAGDSFPDGCPCGEDWLEQVAVCRELGVVVHTVACSGLRERDVFERIAKETYGQCFDLSDYAKLPALITGVADCDLDKQRVAREVLTEVKSHKVELMALREEHERLNAVFATLSRRGTTARGKETAAAEVKDRPLCREDVRQAINALRRAEESDVFEVFPNLGIEDDDDGSKRKAGLFDLTTKAPVPLKMVEAKVQIIGFAAEVEVSQRFVNEGLTPIEAQYSFPVDDLAAVCGFVAEIDGRRVVAKCMAKEKAAQVYDDAVASGHGAYLLEQKRADLFEMTVGNLPPGKAVVIRITYIVTLESHDGTLRFVLPTTVAPTRQRPSIDGNGDAAMPDRSAVPESESGLQIGFSVKVNAVMSSAIKSVVCPTHSVVADINGNETSVALKNGVESEMTADFVLLVTEAAVCPAAAVVEEWDGDGAVTAPATPLAIASAFSPQIVNGLSFGTKPRDVVLAVDCSCSMVGNAIAKARDAVNAFVSALPGMHDGSRFDICLFGSEARFLFGSPRSADDPKARGAAREFLQEVKPTMGGSQLLKALKQIAFQQPLKCSAGHQLRMCSLHEMVGDNPEYRHGFKCDRCGGKEGQPAHCGECEYDICRRCQQASLKKARDGSEKGVKKCSAGHVLKRMSRLNLLVENKEYVHGMVCDKCKATCAIPESGLLHCTACGYDLCPACSDVGKVHVILVTDSAVHRPESINAFLAEQSEHLAVFPIGVGCGLSPQFVRGLAKPSGSVAEFVTFEDISPVVARQLWRIFNSVQDAAVDWNVSTLIPASRVPSAVPPLIGGSQFVAFALAGVAGFEGGNVVLNGTLKKDAPVRLEVGLPQRRLRGKLLHRLCARMMIRELEEGGAANEASVVDLAVKYSLASKFTSFVAVEERDGASSDVMEQVRVPSVAPLKQQQQQQQQAQPLLKKKPAAFGFGSAAGGASRDRSSLASKGAAKCMVGAPARFAAAAPPAPCCEAAAMPTISACFAPAPCAAPMMRMRKAEREEEKCRRVSGRDLTVESDGTDALISSLPRPNEWEQLLLDAGTSKAELDANPKLGDSVLKAVCEYLESKKIAVVPSNGGYALTALSSAQRTELVKLVARLVASTRL